jgi:hypothetical protein
MKRILPEIPIAKAPLGGNMRRRDDSINMDLKEIK